MRKEEIDNHGFYGNIKKAKNGKKVFADTRGGGRRINDEIQF
jgi:hypothetical protein